jgi:hypothetical protein
MMAGKAIHGILDGDRTSQGCFSNRDKTILASEIESLH